MLPDAASLTLLLMTCLALALSILFRFKSRIVNDFPRDLSASVFDKTFNVFNPYPERRKIIHSLLFVLPLVVFACTGVILPLVMEIARAGLLLSLIILIISINLIVVEEAIEIYQNTNIFIKAVRNEMSLGKGDLKVLKVIEKSLPKISNYYLGLGVIFVVLGLTLPYTLPSLLWAFAQLANLITLGGNILVFIPVVLLWFTLLAIVSIFIKKIKDEVFKVTRV